MEICVDVFVCFKCVKVSDNHLRRRLSELAADAPVVTEERKP